jgi:hypothetical protein
MEGNLPTWYSSAALLFCGALLALIARKSREWGAPHGRAWAVLAVVFLLLSLDEAASLHERMSGPTRQYVGNLFNAWVIPASVLLVLGGLAALRFVLGLPRRTRHLVVLGGVMFVGGAVGLEAVAGVIRTVYPYDATFEVTLMALATAEELLEMLGVVVFAYALLDYLSRLQRPALTSLATAERAG